MESINATTFQRDFDLITRESLEGAEVIADLGVVPIPGLFFRTPEHAAGAVSHVRLVRGIKSGLIQLDRDINPALYSNYRCGAVTQAHLEFVESLAADFEHRYARNARILEIGGGNGHLLRALQRRGFRNLHLIDPSPDSDNAVEYETTIGLFPDALPKSALPFDVIVGQHFLEHSSDPVAVLRAAAAMLAPGGEVWIEVPDIAASALEDDGVWLSIVYALHSSYFDRSTLSLAAMQAGLTVRCMKSVDHYGKSLLAVFGVRGESTKPEDVFLSRSQVVANAIRAYFAKLRQFGETVPSETQCWGAAERCITVLGGIMASGFTPNTMIDSNPGLHGLYVSGVATPISSPTDLEGPLSHVLILSPVNAKNIRA